MASLRASEPPEVASKRKEQNRVTMASLRAGEPPEVASKRKEQNRVTKASLRAGEPPEVTSKRKEQNRVAMASLRASELLEAASKRKDQTRVAMASLRASESVEAASKRKDQNRIAMASLRASESQEAASKRTNQSRVAMASLRASEPPEAALKRKEQSWICMSRKRNMVLSIDEAIDCFCLKIRKGPDFVCTVCHRMMYRLGVLPYNRLNYTRASNNLLQLVLSNEYACSDGRQWVCQTCDRQLKKGNLPVQAKANGLALSDIPSELSNLNPLELRLISLRVPFMKMVALPTGKQRCIYGPAINVPSKLDSVCSLLPRLPSQTDIVPLKLKRKLSFKGHYMYDYVSPVKVMKALLWLKANNPSYADIGINTQWSIDSDNDNTDLFSSLIGRSDQGVNFTRNIVTEYDQHYNILVRMANEHGFVIHDVIGNGDCLFNAEKKLMVRVLEQ